MSKSGAYVAPNSRKKEQVNSLNIESDKEFPGLKQSAEVLKKAVPISFAALLKNKDEQKAPEQAAIINNHPNRKTRVVDIPDKPYDEDDDYMNHMYIPDLSKLVAARALRKLKEEREKNQRLFESSSSEGEPPEDDLSEIYGSDGEEEMHEHEDTYDPSEFDRHR